MAVVYENTLKDSLSKGEILPSYIFFGNDGYLINHYENLIINKACGKDNDFDYQKFERNVDLNIVTDALNQFPMLGDKRCIVLSDFEFEQSALGAENFENLINMLSDENEFSTLIMIFEDVEFDIKHSNRAKKLISAVEKSGGLAVALNHRSVAELSKMLINGAKKRGCSLETPVASYMIESCGQDINTLGSELEKVCLYAEGGKITKDMIDNVCIRSIDETIYNYAKFVIACDTHASVKLLNELLFMGIKPLSIAYSTASAFIDIVRADAAKKSGKSASDVLEDFSYKNKSFLIDRARNNSKKFDDKKLSLCLKEILNADKMIKSFSGNDKTVLEQMTIRLIYIIANGEAID